MERTGPGVWIARTGELLEILDINAVQLHHLNRLGLRKVARGRYDLRETLKWFIGHVAGEARAPGESKTLEQARKALIDAQAAKAQLEVAELRGDLVPTDESHFAMTNLVHILIAGFEAMPARLAATLVGQDAQTIEDAIDAECAAVRAQLVCECDRWIEERGGSAAHAAETGRRGVGGPTPHTAA